MQNQIKDAENDGNKIDTAKSKIIMRMNPLNCTLHTVRYNG